MFQVRLEGYTVAAYSYIALVELYSDIFIEQVYYFESPVARPFVVDCGANIGMAVLYFKRLYPESEVWAYEANPEAFALLARNVAANNLDKVYLFNYVLADQDAEVRFYSPTSPAGLNGSLNPLLAKGKEQRLPGYRLSGLLPTGRKVDFMKMDIEGAEMIVLEELREADRLKDISQLVVELHAGNQEVAQKFTQLLGIIGTDYQHKAMGWQHTLGFSHVNKFVRKDVGMRQDN